MNLFKSIISTILIYAVVAGTLLFGVNMISDVYKYADETLAIEAQCRDGNYDAAKVYEVKKAEDGSYTVEYAGRNLDDLVIKAYYDADGNYLYTEKETSQYVFRDIVGTVFVGALMAGFAYFVYVVLVAIVELIVKLFKMLKEKKAKKALAVVDVNQTDEEIIDAKM